MRPYLLVAYNFVRFKLKKLLFGKGFHAGYVEMLSANTKMAISKGAQIHLGERVVSDGRTVITVGESGNLNIGSQVYFNEGAIISCKKHVSIGEGCQFGPNAKIFDNDHKFDSCHGVSSEHVSSPIHIGSHCWFGSNVVVLRGTQIGDNCVVGAGCVVKGNIPTGSLVTMSRELIISPIEERKT